MSFLNIYLTGFTVILIPLTALWIFSIYTKNVSIVDIFWGLGFVILAAVYFQLGEGHPSRKALTVSLVAIWGLRLCIYLAWRNWGKGEDRRYQEFRKRYGPERYWWFSFFQVFLLQGVLMWLISAPLLGAMHLGPMRPLNWLDYLGVLLWLTGFLFESVGDYQLAKFKSDPGSRGKVMDKGLWRYTRHPNYFGDAAIWWGFGLVAVSAGAYWTLPGIVLMTWLLLKVSGVALLEETIRDRRPGYGDYVERTSAFFPWPPKALKK